MCDSSSDGSCGGCSLVRKGTWRASPPRRRAARSPDDGVSQRCSAQPTASAKTRRQAVSRAARGPSPVSGALTRAQRPASVQLSLNAAAQKRRRSGLSVHSTKRVSPGLGWAHTFGSSPSSRPICSRQPPGSPASRKRAAIRENELPSTNVRSPRLRAKSHQSSISLSSATSASFRPALLCGCNATPGVIATFFMRRWAHFSTQPESEITTARKQTPLSQTAPAPPPTGCSERSRQRITRSGSRW
mmetsp:Transcript_39114/g.90616  ORF Transcript_39114/g.90616 Transcript_39114/m.90616 type:complete len:245 (-) Transcript_39114:795-1529(-)